MNSVKRFIPHILFGIYIVLFLVLAISPRDRSVWFVENMTIIPIVVTLVILYIKNIRFSPFAYLAMSCLIYIHTIGGHYTFEHVPFGFISDLFGFERNNYDRMGHFTVGFYAIPSIEYMLNRNVVRRYSHAAFFSLLLIISVAAVYELFEWVYAIMSDPSSGHLVLGSQGDIWDAQKDILADTLGAVVAIVVFWTKKHLEIDSTNSYS